jgi:hypothetical protein
MKGGGKMKRWALMFTLVALVFFPVFATAADWKEKTVKYQGMEFTITYIDHTPGGWDNSTVTVNRVRVKANGLTQIDVGREDGVAAPSVTKARSGNSYSMNLKCLWPAYAPGRGIFVKATVDGQVYTWYPFKGRRVEGEIEGTKPNLVNVKTTSTGKSVCAGTN